MVPYFDAHCDTLSRCAEEGWSLWENPGHIDLKRLSRFSPVGQGFAMFLNGADHPGEALFPKLFPMVRAYEEAKAAAPALLENSFLTIEGGELLNCDPKNLEMAKGWGVKWVNLTWNHKNALSGSCHTGEGLTPLGRDFVRELGRLSMAADVSHLSDRGFWDLMEQQETAVLASHSNSRALCDHPRNLTDEMFLALRERKGFVGINLCTAFLRTPTVDEVVAQIEHFWELGGEDILGLGCDYDGADVPEALGSVERIETLYEALLKRNISDELLYRFAFQNLQNFVTRLH